MGEILKDTSKKIVTLCKCRDYKPVSSDMISCMKACEYYESRSGGWCLYYRKGSSTCDHLVEKKDTTKEETTKMRAPDMDELDEYYIFGHKITGG